MIADLAPCPFCGGSARLGSALHNGQWTSCCTCDSCAAVGGWAKSAPAAVRMWNMRPAEPKAPNRSPGSSAGIHCAHASCSEALVLERTTTTSPTHEQDWREILPACDEAAVFLGWRLFHSTYRCPTHVISLGLVCKRCLLPCPQCSCMGGSRGEAVEGT